MKCYICGGVGKRIGMWFSPKRKRPWVRFRCDAAACRFAHPVSDGGVSMVRPTWMAPLADVGGGGGGE